MGCDAAAVKGETEPVDPPAGGAGVLEMVAVVEGSLGWQMPISGLFSSKVMRAR